MHFIYLTLCLEMRQTVPRRPRFSSPSVRKASPCPYPRSHLSFLCGPVSSSCHEGRVSGCWEHFHPHCRSKVLPVISTAAHWEAVGPSCSCLDCLGLVSGALEITALGIFLLAPVISLTQNPRRHAPSSPVSHLALDFIFA